MKKKVRYHDPDTNKVTSIPARELSDRSVPGRAPGEEGVVYYDHGLSDELVERVKKIASALADVHPDPLQKWLHDINLDQHPEREVAVFEAVAAVYGRVVQPTDSLAKKRDIYRAVLNCSTGVWPPYLPLDVSKKMIWENGNYEVLTEPEVQNICDEWLRFFRD